MTTTAKEPPSAHVLENFLARKQNFRTFGRRKAFSHSIMTTIDSPLYYTTRPDGTSAQFRLVHLNRRINRILYRL